MDNNKDWLPKEGRVLSSECLNGETIRAEEGPFYFKVTVGDKTWYWNRDTSEYDGTSFTIN